jgi:methionine-S-sulfoxide reductase
VETVVLGAGCFWGVEAELAAVPGVGATRAGYAGGRTPAPAYEDVCAGTTGHAEVVEVRFDPARVGVGELVERLLALRDPVVGDARGRSQRRTLVVARSQAAADAARAAHEAVQARLGRPVALELLVGAPFWPAEEHHQAYLARQAAGAACAP